MKDCRWQDVRWSIDQAIRHFEEAISLYDEGGVGGTDRPGYRRAMALMHAMQSGYTSFEAALARTMALIGEERPVGPDWHKQLVERSASDVPGLRPAILPADILPLARKIRGFRHWAMHGYDEPFDPDEAAPTIEATRRLCPMLKPAFDRFAEAIDP